MSKIFVDQVDPKTATTLTLGTSGDTVDIPTGVGLSVTDEVKTNKISPATGTAFALGDSGDTFTVPQAQRLSTLEQRQDLVVEKFYKFNQLHLHLKNKLVQQVLLQQLSQI